MKIVKDRITLTVKEADRIVDMLSTLEAMSGASGTGDTDDDAADAFEKDCADAGRFQSKLYDLVEKLNLKK